MSMKSSRGYLSSLLLFPCLSALAIHFIWGRFSAANVGTRIGVQCQEGFTPSAGSLLKSYYTPYTGLSTFDQAMCPLVAFFDVMINSPDTLPFLTYVIGTSLPLVLLPNVESYRKGQNFFLAYPVVFGLLTQVASIGVLFPIYWLVFILTGGPHKTAQMTLRSYTQAQAQALAFSIIVGAVIPSVSMLILNDFYLTAIWQFYPALVAIAQVIHLQFRPSSKHSSSGYGVLQIIYLGCFMVTSSAHISTVWPMLSDFSSLKHLLIPSVSPLPPSAELSLHLLDFLKWDVLFAYSSTALAMLWYSNGIKQCVLILLWYAAAIPLFGFSAAVMGVAIWKEGIMT